MRVKGKTRIESTLKHEPLLLKVEYLLQQNSSYLILQSFHQKLSKRDNKNLSPKSLNNLNKNLKHTLAKQEKYIWTTEWTRKHIQTALGQIRYSSLNINNKIISKNE